MILSKLEYLDISSTCGEKYWSLLGWDIFDILSIHLSCNIMKSLDILMEDIQIIQRLDYYSGMCTALKFVNFTKDDVTDHSKYYLCDYSLNKRHVKNHR